MKIAKLREQRQVSAALLGHLEESGDGQISLTDPDARLMVAHSKVTVGYNATLELRHSTDRDSINPLERRNGEIKRGINAVGLTRFARRSPTRKRSLVWSVPSCSNRTTNRPSSAPGT